MPKTNTKGDKLLWKHFKSEDFGVKTVYRLLIKDYLASSAVCHRVNHVESKVWRLIWRIKTPHKICTFVWKLLHDSLPTLQLLKNRGITGNGLCPMCNCEEESTTHLFLLCHFARACWHGSPLAVHTSNFIDTSVQQWLSNLIISHNWNEEGFLEYM